MYLLPSEEAVQLPSKYADDVVNDDPLKMDQACINVMPAIWSLENGLTINIQCSFYFKTKLDILGYLHI